MPELCRWTGADKRKHYTVRCTPSDLAILSGGVQCTLLGFMRACKAFIPWYEVNTCEVRTMIVTVRYDMMIIYD